MASERHVIHIGGMPGGGKTRAGLQLTTSFVRAGFDAGFFSYGQRVRDIHSGRVTSQYEDAVHEHAARHDRLYTPLGQRAAAGIMLEYLHEANTSGNQLLFIDGYPRYWQQVKPFLDDCEETGWDLKGSLVAETDPQIAYNRMVSREVRPEPWVIDNDAAVNRLLHYRATTYGLLDCLKDNGIPVVTIDTSGSKADTDKEALKTVCEMLAISTELSARQ